MPGEFLDSKESFSKLLDSFSYRPQINFESQEEDEEVLLLLRAHPVTLVPWVITTIICFFLPILLNVLLINFFTFREVLFIDLVWYSLTLSYAYLKTIAWLFNVGIVTNLRVVDIDFSSIIDKNFSATSLSDITDVSEKTNGFLRSMLQFGNVFVQTAGTNQNIEYPSVPDPVDVVTVINRLM